jgi:hypothetical protein
VLDTAIADTLEFDVALSFASEDRAYVHSVATSLREAGARVFYDEFFSVELWGADLFEYFDRVFRQNSRFIVAFVSKHYVTNRGQRMSAVARRPALSVRMEPFSPFASTTVTFRACVQLSATWMHELGPPTSWRG